MFVKALLAALWTCFCTFDLMGPQLLFYRPLLAGTVTGLIFGNINEGMLIAAVLELMWLGVTGMGASLTLDLTASSIIGTAFGILSGKGLPAAIVSAIPAAIIFRQLSKLVRRLNNKLNRRAEISASAADYRGIEKLHIKGLMLFMASKAVPVLLILLSAGPYCKYMFKGFTGALNAGLLAAGGFVPALGLGAILGFMLDKRFCGFLIFGFLLSACLKVNIIFLIVISLSAAFIYFIYSNRNGSEIEHQEERKNQKLDMPALKKIFIRLNMLQFSINFEGMQNIGYVFCMIPAINKLYENRELRSEALERHLKFFNTNPLLIAPILGTNIALEEDSEDNCLRDADILKKSLMGALGGIGDSITWYTLRPVVMGISAVFALQLNAGAILIVLAVFDAAILAFKWHGLCKSYRLGTNYIKILNGSSIMRIISTAGVVLGLIIIGGLIPLTVNTKFLIPSILSGKSVAAWNILNPIFAFLFTLMISLLVKKGVQPVYIAAAICIICIVFKFFCA